MFHQCCEGVENELKGLCSSQTERMTELENSYNEETRLLDEEFKALTQEKMIMEEKLQKRMKDLKEQNARLDAEARYVTPTKFRKIGYQCCERGANNFKALYSQKEKKIKDLEKEINGLMNEKFEALNKEKISMYKEFQKGIKELKEQNASLDAEADCVNIKIKFMKIGYQRFEKEVNECFGLYSEQEGKIEELEENLNRLMNVQLQVLTPERINVEERIKELKEQNASLDAEAEQLFKSIKFLKMDYYWGEREANKFKWLYSEQEEKIKELEEKLNQGTLLWNEKFGALKMKIIRMEEKFHTRINELEDQIASLDVEDEEYARNEALEQEISAHSEALSKCKTLKDRLRGCEKTNETLKSTFKFYNALSFRNVLSQFQETRINGN